MQDEVAAEPVATEAPAGWFGWLAATTPAPVAAAETAPAAESAPVAEAEVVAAPEAIEVAKPIAAAA